MSNQVHQRRFKPSRAKRVGAETITELTEHERGQSNATVWLGFFGKHKSPKLSHVIHALAMEFLGCMLIAMAVSLARFFAQDTNSLLNGILVGVVYGLAYYAAGKLWNKDIAIPCHLNGAVTVSYWTTKDVGLLGVATYLCVQVLGSLVGGGIVYAMTKGATLAVAASGIPLQTFVPVPTSSTASSGVIPVTLLTTIFLEIAIPAIIVLSHLATQYAGTKEDEENKVANYERAVTTTAVWTAVIVSVLFSFQAYTFSNVAYTGGLFSGIGESSTTSRIGINAMAALNNNAVYANSVFVGQNAAWPLYFFGPLLGGLIGGALFWALFATRSEIHADAREIDEFRGGGGGAAAEPAAAEVRIVESDFSSATRYGQTQVSDLTTPLKRA